MSAALQQALIGDHHPAVHVDTDERQLVHGRQRQRGASIVAQHVDSEGQTPGEAGDLRQDPAHRSHGDRRDVLGKERCVPEVLDQDGIRAGVDPQTRVPPSPFENRGHRIMPRTARQALEVDHADQRLLLRKAPFKTRHSFPPHPRPGYTDRIPRFCRGLPSLPSQPLDPSPRPTGGVSSTAPSDSCSQPSDFERFTTSTGLDVHLLRTQKFKTKLVRLHVRGELGPTCSARALIPNLLRRGCRSQPTMTAISRALENLYGASWNTSIYKLGNAQVLAFRTEYIDDQYLPGKPAIETSVLDLTRQLLRDPILDGDTFPAGQFRAGADQPPARDRGPVQRQDAVRLAAVDGRDVSPTSRIRCPSSAAFRTWPSSRRLRPVRCGAN